MHVVLTMVDPTWIIDFKKSVFGRGQHIQRPLIYRILYFLAKIELSRFFPFFLQDFTLTLSILSSLLRARPYKRKTTSLSVIKFKCQFLSKLANCPSSNKANQWISKDMITDLPLDSLSSASRITASSSRSAVAQLGFCANNECKLDQTHFVALWHKRHHQSTLQSEFAFKNSQHFQKLHDTLYSYFLYRVWQKLVGFFCSAEQTLENGHYNSNWKQKIEEEYKGWRRGCEKIKI